MEVEDRKRGDGEKEKALVHENSGERWDIDSSGILENYFLLENSTFQLS